MGGLLIGVLSFATGLALGAIVIYLVVVSGRQRRRVRAREGQRRRGRRERLLSSLEALDAGLTRLTTAALEGGEPLARARAAGIAQAADAAHRSGDDELQRMVGVVVARCDALSATRREGMEVEEFDQLVRQLGEAQREVYRRMEALLDQVSD
jgi:ABC-type nickel/cobalt efflux system permease component RcnA